ncbi:MAG TPA: hypothetical protein ENJ28_08890 [Gammaproteobacteria bacterium]|nr:hypothetical protein [Gammaproteobacteria bacterium]
MLMVSGISITGLVVIIGLLQTNGSTVIASGIAAIIIVVQALFLLKQRKAAMLAKDKNESNQEDDTANLAVQHEVSHICEDFSSFSQEEFSIARSELGNMRSIINSASESLGHNLSGLESDSENQLALLRHLVDELIEATSQKQQEEQQLGMQQHSQESERIVAELIDQINNVVNSASNIGNQFGVIQEHVNAVDEMIGDIINITSQTNLLALNAAIEAARAGEAGRGFAVVADEVRTLSQRTDQFSEQIRKQIEAIKSDLEQINHTVVDVASTDMGEQLNLQNQIHDMWQDVAKLTDKATGQSQAINEIAERIREYVLSSVLSLQFGDLTVQSIDSIDARLKQLADLMNESIRITQNPSDQAAINTLKAKLETLKSTSKQFELNDKQQNMEEGSIDLF